MRYVRHMHRGAVLFMSVVLLISPCRFVSAQTANARALHEKGREKLDDAKYDEAWSLFRQAHDLDGANQVYARSLMYLSIFQGQSAIFADDHGKALEYFNRALALKKDLSSEQDCEVYTIQRYIDLIREHALYRNVRPDYVHRIQALYIRKTDLKDVADGKGRPVVARGEIAAELLEGSIRYQNMLKFYIETLSRGRVSLSFDRRMVDTTLTRAMIHQSREKVTFFRPDFNSTAESLGPIMFEGRNRYDTTIFYFNSEGFDVMIFSMGVPNIYIPYTWYGPPRGSVGLMLGQKTLPRNPTYTTNFTHNWIIFHEFFHVIERISGTIGPQHAYLKEYMDRGKQNFPDWVPDMNPVWTATEYSWYRYHMLNTLPAQMEKKAAQTGLYPPFRNFGFCLTQPDRTEEYVYSTYTAAVKGISLDNLRRASELLDQAYALRREKKDRESLDALKGALQCNPYNHRVLAELGQAALTGGDAAGADGHFGVMARVFPDPKELFTIATSFLDRNDFPRAAKYLRMIAERPGHNPVYRRWLSRALSAAGEDDAAARALPKGDEDPAANVPVAFIRNRAAGLVLYTAAGPDDEAALSLASPGRRNGFRWRLAPSGERDHVLIVSDYSWNCLEVRGTMGNYAVVPARIEKSDAQKWRLEKGGDGLYRIVSKREGLPLGAVLSADRRRAAIALGSADSQPYWEIETFDPVMERMDFERTVGIVSSHNGAAIDLFGGKTNDGAEINLWSRTGNANQRWKIIPSGEPGYVHVVSEGTWKCMAARNDAGASVTMLAGVSADDDRKWKLVKKGDGGYVIVSKRFNRALEPDPKRPTRAMHLAELDGSERQLWKLER